MIPDVTRAVTVASLAPQEGQVDGTEAALC